MKTPSSPGQRAFLRSLAPQASYFEPALRRFRDASAVRELSAEQAEIAIIRCKKALGKWITEEEKKKIEGMGSRLQSAGMTRGKPCRAREQAANNHRQDACATKGRGAHGYARPTEEMLDRNIERAAALVRRLE